MTNFNKPDVWANLYAHFTETFGEDNVLIAGGCVRDYLVSKRIEPRDIDVFVNADALIDFEIASVDISAYPFIRREEFGMPGYHIVNNKGKGPYGHYVPNQPDWIGEGKGYGELFYVARGRERVKSYNINVIARKDVKGSLAEDFVQSFDINACRAWVDPNTFKPMASDACTSDIANRTLTYGLDKPPTERSLRRASHICSHLSKFAFRVGFDIERPKKDKDAEDIIKLYNVKYGVKARDEWIVEPLHVHDLPHIPVEMIPGEIIVQGAADGGRLVPQPVWVNQPADADDDDDRRWVRRADVPLRDRGL